MSKIEALRSEAMPASSSTEGITRRLAFEGEGYRVLLSQAKPGVASGWHHHGEFDVYGYVASGSARLESGCQGSEVISLDPGDFFHVPPHTIHREINPSDNQQSEVVLFLFGHGPIVINVEDPDARPGFTRQA